MRRKTHKEVNITHIMADGTVLHSQEELENYDFDLSTISPVALRIIRDLIFNPPQSKESKEHNP